MRQIFNSLSQCAAIFLLLVYSLCSFSTFILLVGLPYNLYCVGADVKHCSINQSTVMPAPKQKCVQ